MKIALPWAKKTLLHFRRFVPSPWLCPLPLIHRSIGGKSAPASALAPLGGVCGRPRLRGIRYIFSALFCSISVRDCTAGSRDTLRRSLHGTGRAASFQGTDTGLGCYRATRETARLGPLGRHCKGSISASVPQMQCTERGLQYGRLQVVAVRPVIHQHPRRRRRTQALRRYRCSLPPSLPPPSLPPSLPPSPPPRRDFKAFRGVYASERPI
jgi:hypothetical protein